MMRASDAARVLDAPMHGEDARFTGVGSDSRKVRSGELFVALKGDRFDGHDYVAMAASQGAAAALVSRVVPHVAIAQIVVPDTLLGMGSLAAHWRSTCVLPLVAITGSNGKTTVKEMLASILGEATQDASTVLATEGNLNNAIGVPLMLFRLNAGHRFAVLEMGMNHLKEIDYLTRMAKPRVALVNNAQRAHIGELGSQEKIAEAKGEIYAGLDDEGVAIINADDRFADYWRALNFGRKMLSFGQSERADVRGVVGDDGRMTIHYHGDSFDVTLNVPGEHNAKNALAAAAAAFALGVSAPIIAAGLARFKGVKGRLQPKAGQRGARVIDDSYNANPDSMKAAIRVLAGSTGRKFLVIGDMAELGAFSREAHAEIGSFARKSQVDCLFALGNQSIESVRAFGDGAEHFGDVDQLCAALLRELDRDVTVLVKGSRSSAMERVVERIAQGK